jgi:hypothetical protein
MLTIAERDRRLLAPSYGPESRIAIYSDATGICGHWSGMQNAGLSVLPWIRQLSWRKSLVEMQV